MRNIIALLILMLPVLAWAQNNNKILILNEQPTAPYKFGQTLPNIRIAIGIDPDQFTGTKPNKVKVSLNISEYLSWSPTISNIVIANSSTSVVNNSIQFDNTNHIISFELNNLYSNATPIQTTFEVTIRELILNNNKTLFCNESTVQTISPSIIYYNNLDQIIAPPSAPLTSNYAFTIKDDYNFSIHYYYSSKTDFEQDKDVYYVEFNTVIDNVYPIEDLELELTSNYEIVMVTEVTNNSYVVNYNNNKFTDNNSNPLVYLFRQGGPGNYKVFRAYIKPTGSPNTSVALNLSGKIRPIKSNACTTFQNFSTPVVYNESLLIPATNISKDRARLEIVGGYYTAYCRDNDATFSLDNTYNNNLSRPFRLEANISDNFNLKQLVSYTGNDNLSSLTSMKIVLCDNQEINITSLTLPFTFPANISSNIKKVIFNFNSGLSSGSFLNWSFIFQGKDNSINTCGNPVTLQKDRIVYQMYDLNSSTLYNTSTFSVNFNPLTNSSITFNAVRIDATYDLSQPFPVSKNIEYGIEYTLYPTEDYKSDWKLEIPLTNHLELSNITQPVFRIADSDWYTLTQFIQTVSSNFSFTYVDNKIIITGIGYQQIYTGCNTPLFSVLIRTLVKSNAKEGVASEKISVINASGNALPNVGNTYSTRFTDSEKINGFTSLSCNNDLFLSTQTTIKKDDGLFAIILLENGSSKRYDPSSAIVTTKLIKNGILPTGIEFKKLDENNNMIANGQLLAPSQIQYELLNDLNIVVTNPSLATKIKYTIPSIALDAFQKYYLILTYAGNNNFTSGLNIQSDISYGNLSVSTNVATVNIGAVSECDSYNCSDCITEFSPIPGKYYIVSGWVKVVFSGTLPVAYDQAGIQIKFNSGTIATLPLFTPTGPIVDGWQRVESEFLVPPGARNIQIVLVNNYSNVEAYFDDIRVHPTNSNMRSFVYDPSTQKLVAELDENNFATIYEYDDEGILVRVKKETERGVMTIKETRTNQSKVQAVPGE